MNILHYSFLDISLFQEVFLIVDVVFYSFLVSKYKSTIKIVLTLTLLFFFPFQLKVDHSQTKFFIQHDQITGTIQFSI